MLPDGVGQAPAIADSSLRLKGIAGPSSGPSSSARMDRQLVRRSSFQNRKYAIVSRDLGGSSLVPISDSDISGTPERVSPISLSPDSEGDSAATGHKRRRSSRVVSLTLRDGSSF